MANDMETATEMQIRVLSAADRDAFWQLRLRSLQEEPESFEDAYEESVNMPESEILKRLQSSEDSFVLGAFVPHLVGMVGFYRRPGVKVRHKGLVWGMYVAKEGRGKGLGKALIQTVIERASALPHLEQLHLAVSTHNAAARGLYLSVGFFSYGLEPHAKKLGDQYTDRDLMIFHVNKSQAV